MLGKSFSVRKKSTLDEDGVFEGVPPPPPPLRSLEASNNSWLSQNWETRHNGLWCRGLLSQKSWNMQTLIWPLTREPSACTGVRQRSRYTVWNKYDFFYVFETSLFCCARLHLFKQKYSKNCDFFFFFTIVFYVQYLLKCNWLLRSKLIFSIITPVWIIITGH